MRKAKEVLKETLKLQYPSFEFIYGDLVEYSASLEAIKSAQIEAIEHTARSFAKYVLVDDVVRIANELKSQL